MDALILCMARAVDGPVQQAAKAYEILLQYGAIGACLVIFVVLFIKLLGDNRRLGNMLLERDAAHDTDVTGVHKEYRDRLDGVNRMLLEEKDARRAELFKVAADYSAMVDAMRGLNDAVRSLADKK